REVHARDAERRHREASRKRNLGLVHARGVGLADVHDDRAAGRKRKRRQPVRLEGSTLELREGVRTRLERAALRSRRGRRGCGRGRRCSARRSRGLRFAGKRGTPRELAKAPPQILAEGIRRLLAAVAEGGAQREGRTDEARAAAIPKRDIRDATDAGGGRV